MDELHTPSLSFDRHGHLFPYEIIELTLPQFEAFFVDGLEDRQHRRRLFERYKDFLRDLKQALPMPFYQWICGSFITAKEMPGDIDLVTFLDYDAMARKAPAVNFFTQNAIEIYRVDAHFSPVCKWNHRFHASAKQREEKWLELYSFSRQVEDIRHPKGILKINFP